MGLVRKLLIGAFIGAGVEYLRKKTPESSAAFAGPGHPNNFANVRDAGTDDMRDNPGAWGKVEDESDASFPASDPPANY